MPRLIAFVFCLAFLCAAAGWVKTGMALLAMMFVLLVAYVIYLGCRVVFTPPD